MKKRMFFMLIVVIGFLAVIGFFKYQQIKSAIAQGKAWQPAPEAVTTVVAKQERWRDSIGAIGTVTAVNGVTLTADLPGIVASISFESGQSGISSTTSTPSCSPSCKSNSRRHASCNWYM